MNSLVRFWSEFDASSHPFIHPRDRAIIKDERESLLSHRQFVESNHFPGHEGFHLSLLPVPYLGDLTTAKVFILLLNPSFNECCYQNMEDPEYRAQSIANLKQDFSKTEFPFVSLNPDLASTAGFQWWHKKLGKVVQTVSEVKGIRYLDALKDVSKKIAAIEMVPYRSRSFKANHIIGLLPSAVAAREFVKGELLPRAEKDQATIVITRKRELWGLSSEQAVIYEGGHTRAAHLGPGSRGGNAILERLGVARANIDKASIKPKHSL